MPSITQFLLLIACIVIVGKSSLIIYEFKSLIKKYLKPKHFVDNGTNFRTKKRNPRTAIAK
jgi:hypothetical protein